MRLYYYARSSLSTPIFDFAIFLDFAIFCDILNVRKGVIGLHDRIKKLRKALDLTQREFGERIGVKPNTIATYEIGRNEPIDAVISLICREFSVSETWLRTGEGEMFQPLSPDDELSQVFSAIAASDDELIKRIIRAYWKLDDREKAAVKKLIDGFSVGSSGTLPVDTGQQQEARAPQEMTDAELHAELDRQLLEEKKQVEGRSASGPGNSEKATG